MIDYLLANSNDIAPFYLRVFLFGMGGMIAIFAAYELSHGGAWCHTGWTKFSPKKFMKFEEAPLWVGLNLIMHFVAAGVMLWGAFAWNPPPG